MGKKRNKSMAKRRGTTKIVGETSNSCEFSSFEPTLQKQDHETLLRNTDTLKSELEGLQIANDSEPTHETLLRNAETLKSELEGLQIANERMCGEGVDCLSLPELLSLYSQLSQGLLSVEDQLAKKTIEQEEDDRRLVKQEGEEENTDAGKLLIRTKRVENLKRQLHLSKGRCFVRKKAREFRSSSEGPQGRRHWDDRDTLLQSIEYMKSEIKRLQLLNERMCGKEIEGLNYFQLMVLRREMDYGSLNASSWIRRKKWEEHRQGGGQVGSGQTVEERDI